MFVLIYNIKLRTLEVVSFRVGMLQRGTTAPLRSCFREFIVCAVTRLAVTHVWVHDF